MKPSIAHRLYPDSIEELIFDGQGLDQDGLYWSPAMRASGTVYRARYACIDFCRYVSASSREEAVKYFMKTA